MRALSRPASRADSSPVIGGAKPSLARTMPAEKKSFALRLDAGLYATVARLAGAELRSVNGQIEYLLREALRARGVSPPTDEDAEGAAR